MPVASHNGLSRFLDLDPARRRLLVEAVLTLTGTSFAVFALPFRTAIRLGATAAGEGGTHPSDIVWAIEAAARRLPWRTVCLQKGIAAQRMARRRGHDARLHYGIGKSEDREALQAHVWVTIGGQPLIGGEEAAKFASVAVFP